ncbi:MAG: hypothetical protein ACRENX_07695 [Candidatus Dormibacteria bacterium]
MLQSWLSRLQNPSTDVAPGRQLLERGQGMVEYALILVLIAIAAIAILTVVGGNTSDVFSNINTGLGAASPSSSPSATPTAKPTKTPKATPTPKPTKSPKK